MNYHRWKVDYLGAMTAPALPPGAVLPQLRQDPAMLYQVMVIT